MSLELTDSVIAFVDILGFRKLIRSQEDSLKLFSVIENIKSHNTEKCHVEHNVKHSRESGSSFEMKAMPALTSFSDCVAIFNTC